MICHFCGKKLDIKKDGYWCCGRKKCRSASIEYLINKYEPLLEKMAHDD